MKTAASPSPLSDELITQHGLSLEEYDRILSILGRTPNLTELGIFSVMWSEHCSYKSTRKHLSTLPTKAPWVVCGPGENAGVIDIGDEQVAIFKMESHNHPSFIEPTQGAATGVGGILRDVFTMGARPIANLNALRFGAIDHPKTKRLLSGVVEGIGGYGNCVGVPTVAGECNFHPSYNGNILVNAMTVGIAPKDKVFYSAASAVGSSVVYLGSKTGRDGIHGATMASQEFDDQSEEKRPTVQVGDPFTEKLLIEACLELMATDAIIAIQDMGAAGLTCSSLEMASKGGTGIRLNLDQVPMREPHMTPYEIMLSESQERMLMVIHPEKEEIAMKIFQKWELDCAVIGTITDTGIMELFMHDECVARLPVAPLSDEAPVYDRPYLPTPPRPALDNQQICSSISCSIEDVLLQLLASPDGCSKAWIYEQYDRQVMNDTVATGGDAAIIRIHGTTKAIAVTTDCTPRYCFANPIEGGKQAVVETWRNITATGATPLAITNCLNFGNPERPEIMGQLVGCLQGMAEACRELNYPVVSGNVSLYNETSGQGIFPTPAIGGVGVLNDLSKQLTSSLKGEDEAILLVGETHGHIGSSLFLRECLGREDGDAPNVNLSEEKRTGDAVRQLIGDQLITACHDVSDGGALVALAEMMLQGKMGATITTPPSLPIPKLAWWFGEDQARYILTATQHHLPIVKAFLEKHKLTYVLLGTTGGTSLILDNKTTPLSALENAHHSPLPELMT